MQMTYVIVLICDASLKTRQATLSYNCMTLVPLSRQCSEPERCSRRSYSMQCLWLHLLVPAFRRNERDA